MCGIVGYVGSEFALPILIEGLKKLEYRGYDSAGLAFMHNSCLRVEKKKGRIAKLEESLQQQGLLKLGKESCSLGIGHTRWATHGAPSDENAHPHLSDKGNFAVVHNGIIDNEEELREFLRLQGFSFRSETDSELIAHLIEYHHGQNGDARNWCEAVQLAVADLEGSYALGVLSLDFPDQLIVVRKDSPLIIGIGQDSYLVASDIPAVLNRTRDVMILEDGDMACIHQNSCQILDRLGQPVQRETMHVDWDSEAAEKGGYEHFMIKEIHEAPKAVEQTLRPRIKAHVDLAELAMDPKFLESVDKVQIIACGTAYHAGMIGQSLIETCCRKLVKVDYASEFRFADPIVDAKTLVIIISQSGETLDTLAAMRKAKQLGATTLAIVNVIGSSIAREADHVLYTHAGPEIAVASTKAYSTQLTALYLLTIYLARFWQTMPEDQIIALEEELKMIPAKLEEVLQEKDSVQRFAAEHFNAHSIFFMGRNLDYALSMEASLKLKEISYIHSEAYAGGELKHGTIALIEEGTLVICSLTQPQTLDKMIGNIREVKSRGAMILGIVSPQCVKAETVCDTVIKIPSVLPLLAPLLAVTPAQFIAYYVSVLKGLDVDKPRNLAKSVTVE